MKNCEPRDAIHFLLTEKIKMSLYLIMFVSIELITDIGNHIITEVFQKQAKNYKEIIELLGKTGVTTEIFAKENEDMIKFRNLIAHDYEKITPEGIYENLQKAPDVFREFAKYFVEFMDKNANWRGKCIKVVGFYKLNKKDG